MGFEKLQVLNDKQLQAIEMLLDGTYKINDIVAKLDVDRSTFWDWRKRNKAFIAELDRRTQEHKDFLKNSTQKKFENKLDIAISTITSLAKDGSNEAVKLDAAKYIVERINGKIPNKSEVTVETTQVDETAELTEDFDNWEGKETEETT